MRTPTAQPRPLQHLPQAAGGPCPPGARGPGPGRSSAGLGVLAAATFAGVSIELLPIGLLPQISSDLGTSEAVAGLTVTGYALVVALSATALTAATARWPRRALLLTVLLAYAASTAAAAAAPGVAVLLAARMVSGLCHGVFWSMIAGYAARLVPPEQVGRATSAVFTGNALAVAVGLPLATASGGRVGWRLTFLGAAALTLVVAACARSLLPPLAGAARPTAADGERPVGSVRGAFAQRGVRTICLVTALVILGHYTFFTYISTYLQTVGVPSDGLSEALLAYGVAGVAGTVLLGRAYDRWPTASVAVVTATLLGALMSSAVLVLLGAASWVTAAALGSTTALGAAAISLPVALQAMVLRHAGPAPDAASSLFVAAFNLGISTGALLGGLLLATAGVPLLPVTGLVIAASGAVLMSRTTQGPRARHRRRVQLEQRPQAPGARRASDD